LRAAVGHFRNDARLSDEDQKLISRWVENGAPEGDPKRAPAPVAFLDGWNIGQPDKIFEMPEPFNVPAEGTIDYQWIVLPTGLDKDTWIEGIEVRPGDRGLGFRTRAPAQIGSGLAEDLRDPQRATLERGGQRGARQPAVRR
jgi:hypothetical protein